MNAKDATSNEESPSEESLVQPAEAEGSAAAAMAMEADAGGAAEAPTGEVAPAPVQTVYITAPTPPHPKGNRGLGTLLAVLATLVFAAAYAAVTALLILFVRPDGVADAFGTFVTEPLFYVPVAAFLVFMILWVLLVNRASWWAWVVGSLVIAVATYFASIGVLLLLVGGFGLTASQGAAAFVGFALNPALVAAAIVARETAIWFGGAIAKRGRRVRERNFEAWQEFEREEARKRAEFGGVAAV